MGRASTARPGLTSRLTALLLPSGAPAADELSHMRGAGPGWYYDPYDESVYRFWDGERWTERRSDHFPATRSN